MICRGYIFPLLSLALNLFPLLIVFITSFDIRFPSYDKMWATLSLLAIVPFAVAQAPGDNGEMGGIFGMGQVSLSGGLPKGISIGGFPNGPEFPKPGPRFTSESSLHLDVVFVLMR